MNQIIMFLHHIYSLEPKKWFQYEPNHNVFALDLLIRIKEVVLECDIQSTNPKFIGSEMLPRVPQRSIPIGRNIRLSSVWIPGYCMPVCSIRQLVLLICYEEKIMIKKKNRGSCIILMV